SPPCARSASCVPDSAMRPWSRTWIRWAFLTVERRCAMMIVVRPTARRSSERWIAASVSLSTDEVASSRTRIGGSFRARRALARTARELRPALAHDRVPAAGQTLDERARLGRSRGVDERGLGRLPRAVGHVLARGAVEQERVLAHDPDRAAQVVRAQVAHVAA